MICQDLPTYELRPSMHRVRMELCPKGSGGGRLGHVNGWSIGTSGPDSSA